MIWSWSHTWHILPSLLSGFAKNVEVSALAAVLALALGLLWAAIRYLRIPVLSWIVYLIVEFFRGTPLLVQLYFLFYVLPNYHLRVSAFVTGLIGLGLYFSAYTSEVYRAGLIALPPGQWEACTALGYGRWRTWWVVVLPQVVRTVIPPLGSYVLLLFKESALLSTITVAEVLERAQSIGSLNFRYLEPYTVAGVLFLAVSYPLARAIRRLEVQRAK